MLSMCIHFTEQCVHESFHRTSGNTSGNTEGVADIDMPV